MLNLAVHLLPLWPTIAKNNHRRVVERATGAQQPTQLVVGHKWASFTSGGGKIWNRCTVCWQLAEVAATGCSKEHGECQGKPFVLSKIGRFAQRRLYQWRDPFDYLYAVLSLGQQILQATRRRQAKAGHLEEA